MQTVLYPIVKAILPRLTTRVFSKAENWGRFYEPPGISSVSSAQWLCRRSTLYAVTPLLAAAGQNPAENLVETGTNSYS